MSTKGCPRLDGPCCKMTRGYSTPDFRFLNVNFTRASNQPPVASEAEPAVVMEPEPAVAALSPLPEINEGDTFFALATFVSETGEAMNLVEGEKVQTGAAGCVNGFVTCLHEVPLACLGGMAAAVLAQQPVQLSEKCLQNLLLNLPPHVVVKCDSTQTHNPIQLQC